MLISDPAENLCLDGKKALVVDDMGAAVAIAKNMVQALGARVVDTAGDYKTAFPMIAKRQYDLILCDFNLGKGLNGQQLLRDLRHIKRISYQTLFIVVSAERTKDIVLGTIECEPDGYIAKPFTQGDFKLRITRLVEQQQAFQAINLALDNGEFEEAFKRLDQMAQNEPKYRFLALRKKAGILYEQQRFADALRVFDAALEPRKPTWARIGRARCLEELGKRQQAISELRDIIDATPLAVAAIDSLATCHLRDGRRREAQRTVEKSIALSPMSIERQRWLGDISMEIGDVETAVKAYGATLDLASDTLKENPKLHDTYVRTVRKAIESETDPKRCNEWIALGKQAIKAARKKYDEDGQLHLNESLLRSLERFQQGKSEEAIAVIDAAMERHKTILAEDPELVIDIAETKFYTGDLPGAEMILRKLMKDNPDNPKLRDRIQAIIDTPIPYHKRLMLNELNRQGKQSYDAGEYEEALKAFRDALRVYPYHPAVNLNAVQVTLKLIEEGSRTPNALKEASEYLSSCVNLEEAHPEYRRKEAFRKYLAKQLGK